MLHRVVEIHDDGITINVIAVKLDPVGEDERNILVNLEGFRADGKDVLLIDLNSMNSSVDPHRWSKIGVHPRTLTIAHLWIQHNFERLPDGIVQRISVDEILEARLYPQPRVQDVPRPRAEPNGA